MKYDLSFTNMPFPGCCGAVVIYSLSTSQTKREWDVVPPEEIERVRKTLPLIYNEGIFATTILDRCGTYGYLKTNVNTALEKLGFVPVSDFKNTSSSGNILRLWQYKPEVEKSTPIEEEVP